MANVGPVNTMHETPTNTELAMIIAFIDQNVPKEMVQHRYHIRTLLQEHPLIARSIYEEHFLCRVLSMYIQTVASTGAIGTYGTVNTSTIKIRAGVSNHMHFVALTADEKPMSVISGKLRSTPSAAEEAFIDAILTESQKFMNRLREQMAASSNQRQQQLQMQNQQYRQT